jgi:polyferredoxin
MVWFLPLITIGGLFYPVLGYIVVAMIAFFLTLSYFKVRYWCWNLCPRGAFLDGVMKHASLNKSLPRIFTKAWFKWSVFAAFMAFLVLRIKGTGGSLIAVGAVFVSMCLMTTVISIVLAIFTKHRGWCAICPMGTLQQAIGSLNKPKAKNDDQKNS